MRQQDVALSQLENHPEGYNMLTRMYEQVMCISMSMGIGMSYLWQLLSFIELLS